VFPAGIGGNKMKHWKHLNLDQRKLISNMLSKSFKLVEIADILQMDPSSLSKELKRNRILAKKGIKQDKVCKHTIRFPYVCNGCAKKYNACPFTQYRYDSKVAQDTADMRLVQTRQGLNMSPEAYQVLDKTIKEGIAAGQSVYHIVQHHPQLEVSVPTVYRLINTRQLSTKRMDLPYAVRYKKRKSLKQYEYKENNRIDRSKRTYLDFLAFQFNHPGRFHVQMDFLGSIQSDKKSILTLTIPGLHVVLLFLVESPNSQKVIDLFDQLEHQLTPKWFAQLFPFILTDRDPCFSQFDAIEASTHSTHPRTHLFYCDSFNSSQKANVEQMNKQLRKYFPKGKSIDHLSRETVREVNHFINTSRIASLSGATPNEALSKLYGQEVLDLLTHILI
jgi:IS30 family transposase